jgi:hypothetical protein
MNYNQAAELVTLLRSLDARFARLEELLKTNNGLMPMPYKPASLPSIYRQEDHQNERIVPRYPREAK